MYYQDWSVLLWAGLRREYAQECACRCADCSARWHGIRRSGICHDMCVCVEFKIRLHMDFHGYIRAFMQIYRQGYVCTCYNTYTRTRIYGCTYAGMCSTVWVLARLRCNACMQTHTLIHMYSRVYCHSGFSKGPLMTFTHTHTHSLSFSLFLSLKHKGMPEHAFVFPPRFIKGSLIEIHVCMHIHMHTYTSTHANIHLHIHTHARTHTHTGMCKRASRIHQGPFDWENQKDCRHAVCSRFLYRSCPTPVGLQT